MTTKKREVYQFLAMTVNPIQNYVSYMMKKPGSEKGTSKARHILKLVKPATQPYHQGSRFFSPISAPSCPLCWLHWTLVSLMVLKWVIHIDERKGGTSEIVPEELSQRPPSNLPCFWLRTRLGHGSILPPVLRLD